MLYSLLIILIILIISIAIGGPIATTLGFTASMATLLFLSTGHLSFLATKMYDNAISTDNVIVPLFIMMAEFMAKGGIAEDIYYVMAKYLRKIKGGLAVATTLACTIFAALCGSSPATAATIGKVSLEAMRKRGYRDDFSIGTVAGGGTLGIMIPPSITLVMYGILTQTSILKLLMAGILPGLLLSALMCVYSIVRAHVTPEVIGQQRHIKGAPAAQQEIVYEEYNTNFLQDFAKAGPALILIAVIIYGMYSGAATATECAGLGAVVAFLLVVFKRKMNTQVFFTSMEATVKSSSMMILMLTAALMLTNVVARLGIATALAQMCTSLNVNRWVIMIMLFILWYFLGCIMSPTAMVTLTIPFVFTPLTQLGFAPIWLGIVSTLCVEVGMITPPVGNNLFILKQTTGLDIGTIIKGALPQIGVLTFGLAILCICPSITTFIPSLMST
ncbi:MAG: TRAP transporter large permease [Oscillospiraceae bacterium]|nr:TRAP transporter large permease [Oscillospiraceae bacterium]